MTRRRERFVVEYLKDLNATQAAIRAGFSKKTAGSVGHDLLKIPEIQAAIGEKQAIHLQNSEISAERTLEEIRRIAFSDLRRVFTDWGALKPIHELPDEVAAVVASLEVVKKNLYAGDKKVDTVHKLKAWDKLKALELLARHLNLVQDKPTVTVNVDNMLLRLDQGRERAAKCLPSDPSTTS